MHHVPWRAMLIGAVAIVLIYTATRPDPETSGLTQASTDQLIEQLNSSREVVQRAAASRLIGQGESAIPPMVAALEEASDPQVRQIFLVLEDLYLSADPSVSDAVEDAVEQLLSHQRNEVRKSAEELFQSNQSRRQLRAFAKIEAFSGKLVVSPVSSQNNGDSAFPDLVIIDSQWTGGDDGMKYLRRMRGLKGVHIGNAAPISEESIQSMKNLVSSIRRESEGCLGVELTPRLGELVIRWVVPKSPAERAGLRTYDQITRVDGQPVDDYLDFLKILRSHQPGSDLQIEVLREEGAAAMVAVLGSDYGTGRCRCVGDAVATSGPVADEAPRSRGRRLYPMSDHFISPATNDLPSPREFPAREIPGPDRIPR